MSARRSLAVVLAAVLPLFTGSGRAADKPVDFDKAEISYQKATIFFETQQILDDNHTDFNRRFHERFKKQDSYSRAQLLAILDPKMSGLENPPPEVKEQMGPTPHDTLSLESLEVREGTLEQLDPANKGALQRLVKRGGTHPQDFYRAEQVRDAEGRKDDNPPSPETLARARAIDRQRIEAENNLVRSRNGWRAPRIRHDWRDVLYDEDPSQDGNRQKALGDLTGAQFTYAHNGLEDTDTWTVHGAVIEPYTRSLGDPKDAAFALRAFALAPSATFDRVSTNGDPSVEQDTILYRVGVYADFLGLGNPPKYTTPPRDTEEALARLDKLGSPLGLQVRAAGVYVTDFDHRAGLAGFEADIEPRFIRGPLRLGFKGVQLKKYPRKSDLSDSAWAEWQARAWLHVEGGDVQDAGEAWADADGSFLRLGPSAQFTLKLPALPGDRTLSWTTLGSYLPAVIGPNTRSWYVRTTLAYDLFRDVELNHKVAITLDYQRGGLTFTKTEVDQLTLGLSVLY